MWCFCAESGVIRDGQGHFVCLATTLWLCFSSGRTYVRDEVVSTIMWCGVGFDSLELVLWIWWCGDFVVAHGSECGCFVARMARWFLQWWVALGFAFTLVLVMVP
jgi:hypothetical protein